MSATPSPFLYLLPLIPMAGVWVVGLILAVTRWNRHRAACLWLIFALLIQLANGSGMPLLRWYLTFRGDKDLGMTATDYGWVFGSLAIISSLLTALSWSLVLVAVFAGRQPSFQAQAGGPDRFEGTIGTNPGSTNIQGKWPAP